MFFSSNDLVVHSSSDKAPILNVDRDHHYRLREYQMLIKQSVVTLSLNKKQTFVICGRANKQNTYDH